MRRLARLFKSYLLYFVSDPELESESESIRSPESEPESESEQPHHDSAPLKLTVESEEARQEGVLCKEVLRLSLSTEEHRCKERFSSSGCFNGFYKEVACTDSRCATLTIRS